MVLDQVWMGHYPGLVAKRSTRQTGQGGTPPKGSPRLFNAEMRLIRRRQAETRRQMSALDAHRRRRAELAERRFFDEG